MLFTTFYVQTNKIQGVPEKMSFSHIDTAAKAQFFLGHLVDTDHSGKYVIEKYISLKNINATKNTTANKYFAF